jgi:hypothetical protein
MPDLNNPLHLEMLQESKRSGQIERDGLYGTMDMGDVDASGPAGWLKRAEHYRVHIKPAIEGWLNDRDVYTLIAINQIQQARRIAGALVEVGVYRGKCLALMAIFRTDAETVYGLDLFTPPASRELAEAAITKATGGVAGVKLIAADSQRLPDLELAKLVPERVRLLHIDGSHEFEAVLSDLRKFGALMREDGVIAVDDFYVPDYPGVCAAASDFVRESDFVPFFGGAKKLYLCRRARHKDYMRSILRFKPLHKHARLARFREHRMIVGFAAVPQPVEEILAGLT